MGQARQLPVPRGAIGWLLRFPVWLDEAGCGRLLRNRFVVVDHLGRRTGHRHRTPLEVIRYDPGVPEWTVIAAWRDHPDWYRNLQAAPPPALAVGGRHVDRPACRFLDTDERVDVLAAYAAAHPLAMRILFRVMRWGDPRRPGTIRRAARDHGMVAFRPGC
jgi:deazaflavin-dependent oxidoreductase (nitroreductase family)